MVALGYGPVARPRVADHGIHIDATRCIQRHNIAYSLHISMCIVIDL